MKRATPAITLTAALLAFTGALFCGCVSPKPFPYEHTAAKPPKANAARATLAPIADQRGAADDMDKVLLLPGGIDTVLLKELEGSGLFSAIALDTNSAAGESVYIQGALKQLQWEVPGYDGMIATTFLVSMVSGGIGGFIYGSTPTDVYGRAAVHFTVSRAGTTVLDRDYAGEVVERKAKLSMDTPNTYRLVAAKALRVVIDKFKADLEALPPVEGSRAEAKPD